MSKFDGTGTQNTLGSCGGGTPTVTLSPASATYTEGQSVTVTITSFTANTGYGLDMYDENGDPVSPGFSSVSGNEIVLGAGQTSGSLVVTLDAGSGGAIRRRIEVYKSGGIETLATSPLFYVIPCPSLTVTATPSLTIGSGQSVTLTAASVGAVVSPVVFQWQGQPVSSTYAISSLTATNTYSVTGTTGNCKATTTATVSVTAAISLTAAAASSNLCVGATTTLSVSAVGGTAPYSYTWTAPAGVSITAGGSSSVASVSMLTSGAKTFTVTVAGSGGSPVSTTLGITGYALPTPGITASPGLTFCSGTSITLTATGAGAGGAYRWSTTEQTNPISVSLGQQYSVTVVSSQNCMSTTSVTTVRRSLPTATVSALPSLSVCPGQSLTLTANGQAGAPEAQGGARVANVAAPVGLVYNWSTGSNTASTVLTPASSTAISLTVSDGYCSASAISTSVVVKSVTSVSITVPASPTLTCSQSTLSLTAVAGSGSTYRWDNNSTNATRVVSTSGVYSVTATENGCSTTATTSVSSNTTAPSISISSSNLTICEGSSTTLTASGAGAGGSYAWDLPASTSAISVSLGNTYSVTGTASNGCRSTTSVTVTVDPAVNAAIGGNLTICSGNSATLTTGTGSTYSWSDGYTGASNIVSPVSTTAYSVTVSRGVCSATATATVTVNTSPTVSIAASSTSLTGGQSATLTASGATSYTWSTPSNATTITVSPTTTTVYSVSGTQNGCLGEATTTVSVSCVDAIARAISVTLATALGPGNCSINLQGQGTGSSFILTGPGGYVYSTVYRRTGTYSFTATKVTQPGTYTLTARATNACGQESVDTITYVVTGTACP